MISNKNFIHLHIDIQYLLFKAVLSPLNGLATLIKNHVALGKGIWALLCFY